MAARLGLARANVTTPDGEHKAVSVLVANNVATLRRGRDVVATMEGVTSASKTGRATWSITDGTTVWLAVRLGGGCCGSR